MSKEYYCKQLINDKPCGKTNSEEFVKGRYTCCIDCKNRYHKNYHKKVVSAKEIEMNMTLVERINENKGDLGKNVHNMIVDIYQTYPLQGIGIAIPVKLKEFEDDIVNFKTSISIIMRGMDKKIDQLIKENLSLREEKENLKKNNEDLKSDIDELNEKYGKLILKYDTSF
jgi:hypothetical protein